ncbi:hypothetical protein CNR22_18820 [Sphingobacteriaceae bacterium]|nr:hypothetical protein CNR22_18820 [Sphingobacteriaceae bacterium]
MSFRKIVLLFVTAPLASCMSAQSVGGITTGAVQYCDSLNSGFISLTLHSGQIQRWEVSTDKGLTWINLPNTTSTQSYNRLKQTSSFRAIVRDGQLPEDTSSISTVTVYVKGNTGTLSGGGNFCNQAEPGSMALNNPPGNIKYWQFSTTEGADWSSINNTSTQLNHGVITQNTKYRVVLHTIPGCPDDTTSALSFNIQQKTIAGIIAKSDSLCYGAPGDTLRLTGYAGKIVSWFSSKDGTLWNLLPDTGAFTTYSNVTQTNWYKATVKNGICPAETTVPAVIALHNANPASAGEDVTITRNEKINLQGSGNGNPEWNNPEYLGDPKSFTPLADPLNTTLYQLTLTDEHGCITKDSVTITVIVPLPTAITPNGDGLNDFFEIDKITDYPQNSLMIFDRWGLLLYKASPYTNNWNGKSESGHDLPDALYYYIFDFGNGEKIVSNCILIKR